MAFEFARATSTAEIEAVQQLRFQVYVREMQRYHAVEGADDGRFAEAEDARSWICYARDGSEVVAATRMTWGGDGFSERQVEQYQLSPFLAELPAELMGVGERNTVLPTHRGSGVLEQLLAFSAKATDVGKLRLVFGCCEPHLLPLYLTMGQRTYAERNINSPSAGYLIPLVAFLPDVDSLRGLGFRTLPGELPACVRAVVDRSPSVRSETLSAPDDYWTEIRRTLDDLDAAKISTFDGFSESEAHRCIARSTIIECAAGDRLLRRGGTSRNIFVVLDGALEVRDGNTIVNVLTAGDAFGELAFLLERPRSFDVDAAMDGTRVLSLSEGTLRAMIADDAVLAAKLLLNLSRMLCVKLIRASLPASGQ
jgi:Cyclic nucleotide-binding domain